MDDGNLRWGEEEKTVFGNEEAGILDFLRLGFSLPSLDRIAAQGPLNKLTDQHWELTILHRYVPRSWPPNPHKHHTIKKKKPPTRSPPAARTSAISTQARQAGGGSVYLYSLDSRKANLCRGAAATATVLLGGRVLSILKRCDSSVVICYRIWCSSLPIHSSLPSVYINMTDYQAIISTHTHIYIYNKTSSRPPLMSPSRSRATVTFGSIRKLHMQVFGRVVGICIVPPPPSPAKGASTTSSK